MGMMTYPQFKKWAKKDFTETHPHMSKEEYLGAMVSKLYHGWKNYYKVYKVHYDRTSIPEEDNQGYQG